MALNDLTEKLEGISEQELGVEFNEDAIWAKLEHRLDNRKRSIYWWGVAACLLIGLTFLPISFLNESEPKTLVTSEKVQVPNELVEAKPEVHASPEIVGPKMEIITIEKRGIAFTSAAQLPQKELSLEQIPVIKQEKHKTAFAAEDISVIQASLGRPSIERGKNVTVRAQLHTSTQPIQFNNQVFKIKLFEGSDN